MKSTILNPHSVERANSVPTIKKFSEELEKLSSYDIFSLESQFSEIAKGDFINELLNFELTKMAKDELYFPSYSTYTFLNLLKSKYCDLSMAHSINIDYTQSKNHSAFSRDTMVLSLTKRPIKYSLYCQTQPFPLDVLDKTKTLKLIKENASLNYGEILKLRKHEDILVYNENGDEDVLTLVLVSEKEEGILWEYDSDFNPSAIVSGNQESSRLEHVCTMFGELGNESSINSLKELVKSKYFNVRWAAAKAIMLINTEEGLNALEVLSKDEHPEIKDSAIKHLTQLKTLLNKN